MMKDDGTWINRPLSGFGKLANSEKLLALNCLHDSVEAVPVIHRLWIGVAPCAQPVSESRDE